MTKEEYAEELCKRENQNFLFSYINKYVFGKANVEDLLQSTNIKILEKYSSYKENGKFKSWIASIAFWTTKNYQKKMAYSRVFYNGDISNSIYSDNIDYSIGSKNYFNNYESESLIKKINGMISKKSPNYQEVFNLSMDGYKPNEISKKMGISIQNVYKIKARIMNFLKDKIKDSR